MLQMHAPHPLRTHLTTACEPTDDVTLPVPPAPLPAPHALLRLAWEPKASSHHWAGLGLPNGAVPWRVSHFDASRVLAHAFLSEDFMDVVDVDAFGLPGAVLTPAVGALRFGGLLTVAVSDGPACGGHRPAQCLAHLGAAVLPGPCGDELVLR